MIRRDIWTVLVLVFVIIVFCVRVIVVELASERSIGCVGIVVEMHGIQHILELSGQIAEYDTAETDHRYNGGGDHMQQTIRVR